MTVTQEAEPTELREAALPDRSAIARGLVIVVLFCSLVPGVLGLLGRWSWLLDLCNHFRFQYVLLLFVSMLALVLLRSWKLAAVSLMGLVLNLVFVVPLYMGAPPPEDTHRPTMTVMHFNINTGNNNHADVIGEIQSHTPDLLFLQEVNQRWLDALSAGLGDYELVIAKPRTDNFGICCFVRKGTNALAVERSRMIRSQAGSGSVPMIELVIESAGRRISLLSIHPLPPMSAAYARARDAALDQAGRWAARQATPCVVVGDFNATPWSTAFRDLQSAGGLMNSQVGFGQAATWPAAFNTLGMIPIDHLLHSEQLVTVRRVVGRASGSDHKPLIVELGWAKQS